MKIKALIYPALSISLALVACAPQQALYSPSAPQATVNAVQAGATQSQTQTQTVSFTYTVPQSFSTQAVDINAVKFIKLTLVGDGVNGTLNNDGGFIAVTNGAAAAKISNVPIQPGKVRVVTVKGYDANQQPLPAFVGKGYYTSQSGQVTVNIVIDRRRLVTGLIIEQLLQSDPAKANSLDLTALQTNVDAATGFNNGSFTIDPTQVNIQALVTLINSGQTPSSAQIQGTAQTGNVALSLKTTGGGVFTEALTIEVNDPESTVQNIAPGATSAQNVNLQVAPGNWTLQIKKADGTVVGTTTVAVAANGNVTLGETTFTLQLKPRIDSVTPATLDAAAGGTVTITGSGFTDVSAVQLGSTNATSFTFVNDGEISATFPAGTAGNNTLTVTTPGGVSDTGAGSQITLANRPSITSLSAANGIIGGSLTINGANFTTPFGSNTVKFGNVDATVTAGTTNSLTVTVPSGITGQQNISVTANTLVSANTAADDFTVRPNITSLSTSSGVVGSSVTLTGTGFIPAQNAVKFDAETATIAPGGTDTSLTVTVPSGTSGIESITVTDNSSTLVSAGSNFSVVPQVTGVSPNSGNVAGGTSVTLNGTGFTGATSVNFGGTAGSNVNVASNIQLTVTAPAQAAGQVNITVTTPGGTSTTATANQFSYVSTVVSTFAGSGTAGFADAQGTSAQFSNPEGIGIDSSDNVYVLDGFNYRIRKIDTAGNVTTAFGNGTAGATDAQGTNAQFNRPRGIVRDSSGNLYVADSNNHRIRKIDAAGNVTTFAGSTFGFSDGQGANARFANPIGITIDSSGNLYVADIGNNRIRKIDAAGNVTTLAGSTAGFADGQGANAQFDGPTGITIDSSGNLYVADSGNNRIRKIDAAGNVTTLAGSTAGFADGQGANARFANPIGITIDSSGNLYVADIGNNRIRKITNP